MTMPWVHITSNSNTWLKKIPVSLEDIKEVAKKILDEKQIFFLIIGNPSNLKNITKI